MINDAGKIRVCQDNVTINPCPAAKKRIKEAKPLFIEIDFKRMSEIEKTASTIVIERRGVLKCLK